ncbi:tripartite tricarboxylate transporter TctB family protein [Roseobacter sp.]|uniref:tripartite tricarboxylate transporter TctB family protein n=1 Tax=Roseobacter sp. TaxID=1907202 RepID=UPI00385DC8E0
MRIGEITTAGILALFSLYLMWKSTELPVGYIQGQGPGGGAWPFWLSAIMLVCCGMTALKWWRRASPQSRSDAPVLDTQGWKTFIFVGGAVVLLVALVNVISMYGAIALFLFYYSKFLGRHGWGLSLSLALITPVAFFFFFEGAMRITMPTGLPFTDPVFNVLYEIIY